MKVTELLEKAEKSILICDYEAAYDEISKLTDKKLKDALLLRVNAVKNAIDKANRKELKIITKKELKEIEDDWKMHCDNL